MTASIREPPPYNDLDEAKQKLLECFGKKFRFILIPLFFHPLSFGFAAP
ncbi:MAG: hypothetical protein RSA55_00715 [Clostridia bacterium]